MVGRTTWRRRIWDQRKNRDRLWELRDQGGRGQEVREGHLGEVARPPDRQRLGDGECGQVLSVLFRSRALRLGCTAPTAGPHTLPSAQGWLPGGGTGLGV